MAFTEPADIVYLWVDGSDPVWRGKRQRARQRLAPHQHQAIAAFGDVEGRFRNNDELRYSLRALERFFPQHGHVYLVTDGQTPDWLSEHPQLTVVDHRALIPCGNLPTFDSCHIESYIHRIPQLSERYFYCNDDVFFGAPVQLAHWFWEGGVYAGWSDEPPVRPGPVRRGDESLANACRQSIAWLDAAGQGSWQAHYRHTYRTFSHAPRPMRKSVLLALEDIAPDLFAKVRSTVFRSWDKPSVVSDFVLRWSLAQGLARIRDYAHVYVASGATCQASGLERLVQEFGDLDFFCINDTLDNAPPGDPRMQQMRQALQGLLGTASRYERAHSLHPPHGEAVRPATAPGALA